MDRFSSRQRRSPSDDDPRTSRDRRILFVSTSFPRGLDDGAGHFVRTEARHAAAGGATVHVVSAGGRYADAADHHRGVTHWSSAGGRLFESPGILARLRAEPWHAAGVPHFLVAARRRLRQLLPADRIIAHWLVPCAWPLSAGLGTPIHGVAHGADVRLLRGLPSSLRRAAVGQLLNHCDRLQFVAQDLLDSLSEALPPRLARQLQQRADVAPCRIEVKTTSTTADTRASLGVAAPARLVVAVGRLIASKRVDMLLNALEACPQLHCAIIGDGPEQPRLRALAGRLGLHRVHFCGKLERQQTLNLIAAADLLVSCSAAEGAPTCIREARALATPVLSSNVGDVARWSRSDPGIALVAANPDALADALRQYLARTS